MFEVLGGNLADIDIPGHLVRHVQVEEFEIHNGVE
jgi:hypothetical protein